MRREGFIVGMVALGFVVQGCAERRATVRPPAAVPLFTVFQDRDTAKPSAEAAPAPPSEGTFPPKQAQRQPCHRIRPAALAVGAGMFATGVYFLKSSNRDQTSGTPQPHGNARPAIGIGLTISAPVVILGAAIKNRCKVTEPLARRSSNFQ
jgi:hypothetical protein